MVKATEPLAEVSKRAFLVEKRAGEDFYSPERPARCLYVLIKGRVIGARLTPDGERLITDVLEPFDVFGDLCLGRAPPDNEFAQAQTKCQAMAVDAVEARTMIASQPELAVPILTQIARRLDRAHDRLEEFAFSPAESRVASAVLQLVDCDDDKVRATHQLLADIAGTSRETTSRLLARMEAQNILSCGRGEIEIKDPEMLADTARVSELAS